ncbi:potassium transport protein [Physcia stellaris]|nr:potassium transport protein [Physcia stellaris]
MSLLDANMVAFQTSVYMLITMGLLILAGNTCYPIFLRVIIWTLLRLLPDNARFEDYRSTLRFLLDHPRRCYTTLFPSKHTWWLFAALIGLNGIDWAAFAILDIGNQAIGSLPPGIRAIDGLFQALAVRSGGFYVVPIPELRVGLLILYVIMMYISVYPVVITMRNSNVYEERSLGIYSDDPIATEQPEEKQSLTGKLRKRMTTQQTPTDSRGYFVRQQLRGQLAHDLWWIVLAILFINIIETGSFERDPIHFSVFNYIFEIISAYGE